MRRAAAEAERRKGGSGYALSRFNAVKHGVLSRYAVLPWEDRSVYEVLHASLVAEHRPAGPTEEHLVEELAGIIWRKRRLRLAEAAAFRRGLEGGIDHRAIAASANPAAAAAFVLAGHSRKPSGGDVADAVHGDADEAAGEVRDLRLACEGIGRASAIARAGGAGAYDRALAALHPETREWWEETLEGCAAEADPRHAEPAADADGLAEWLESEAIRNYWRRLSTLWHDRDAIRERAVGDAFMPHRLEPLARLETHLDRKLERTLAMLVRLRQLRGGQGAEA